MSCTRCKQTIKEDQHNFVQFACKQRHRYHTTCFNEKQPLPQQCLECQVYSSPFESLTTIDIPVGKVFQTPTQKKEAEIDDGFRVDDGESLESERHDTRVNDFKSTRNAASSPLFPSPTTQSTLSAMAPFSNLQSQLYGVPSGSSTLSIQTFPQIQHYPVGFPQSMQSQQPSVLPQLQSQQQFQSLSLPLRMQPQHLPPMSSSFGPTSVGNLNELLQSISMSSTVTYATTPTMFSGPSLPQHNKFTHQSNPRQYWIVIREQKEDENTSIEDDPRAWLKANKPFVSKLQSKRYFYQMFATAGVTQKMWKDLGYGDISGYKQWSAMQQQLPPGFLETKFYDELPELQ